MKDLIKNNWLATVVALAVVAIVGMAFRAGVKTEAIVLLVGGLCLAVGKLFHHMPPPGAAVALLLLLATPTFACTPAQRAGIPVLSTIDAVGMGLAKVAGICEDAGADDATFERAKQAKQQKDYAQAVVLLSEVATSLRATGHDVPDDAFVTLKLVEQALAADAVAAGMRALITEASTRVLTQPSATSSVLGS